MGHRILVTGGAGCIGSDLAETRLSRGFEVLALDNLSSGKEEHIDPLRSNPCFHFIHGDLLDFDKVQQAVRGVDMVYHLAANPDVKFTGDDPIDKDLKQNTISTYHVLERCGLDTALQCDRFAGDRRDQSARRGARSDRSNGTGAHS
jgi:UDP-glucose 4-epimerase